MAISRRERVQDESNDVAETESPSVEAPRRSSGVKRTEGRASAWSAVGKPKEERTERKSAPYINFNKKSGTKVVHMVHNGPTAEYKRHFVKSLSKMFYCPKGEDEDNFCSLCDKGHPSRWVFRFNVVEMGDDPTEVRTFDLNWTDSESLVNLCAEEQGVATDKVRLNDLDIYWKIVYTYGSGNTIFPIDARTLEKKQYNMVPLTEEDLADLEQTSYGLETVFKNGDKYLREAAQSLRDSDFAKDN